MRQQAGAVFVNEDRELAFNNFINAYSGKIKFNQSSLFAFLHSWRLLALEDVRGYAVGALAIRDHEAHIAILPAFRGKWQMKNTMDALCSLFNITHTWVPHTMPRARDFLKRSGWEYGGNYERGWYFIRKNHGTR